MTLKEAIQQLKDCKFTCEAGPLENNVAFQFLDGLIQNAIEVPADHPRKINLSYFPMPSIDEDVHQMD